MKNKKRLRVAISGVILLGLFLCAQPLFAAVLDLQVGALSDDGYEFGDTAGVVINDPIENKIYSDTSTTSNDYRYGGFRWTNVTIPPGATITAAYISVYPSLASYEDLAVDIHFQAADNPVTFTTAAYNISSRPRTAAFTPWVANLPVGAWYNSPSIVSVVQEIVNRGGWSSGNAMAAIFVPNIGPFKRFRCQAAEYSTPGFGAKLHIEYTTTPLFRSVGTNGANLNTGGRTVQISGTTATFSGSMLGNVGVGDVLQYQVAATYYLAFIHGRTSDTVYTVKSASGGNPQAAAAGTSVNVYRAYTSLAKWQALDENDSLNDTVENFDTSKDLVAANTIMNVACYGDGQDSTTVIIDGWTTGIYNYINIYTPYLSSEVGASQRHNGKWDDTKYRLSAAPSANRGVVEIREDFVRIEGLQVYVTGTNNQVDGIGGNCNYINNVSDIRISHNIVRGGGSLGSDAWGIGIWAENSGGNGPTVRIWNNIVYDFTCSACAGVGVGYQSTPTAYLYNNTVYNCSYGIHPDTGGTIIAKNNIAYSNSDNYYLVGTFGAASTNNLSGPGSDAQIPPTGARNGVTVTFVDPNGSPRDLHLASTDAGARNYGANLSSDLNLAFSDDIDGHSRGFGSAWDIGADEYVDGLFEYRRQITLNDTMTPASCGANLSNFPVLINFSNQTWLKTKANGGNVYNSNGCDIVFRASDGRTHLDHEIESYDGINGTLVAWVKIPTLIYNGSTNIYMYYGNAAVTSPTENPTGVWDEGGSNNYKGVWHLKESGNGTLNEYKDSTANVNHGTGGKGYSSYTPIRNTGKIGYGQTLDGTNDFIDMASSGWYNSNWPYRKRIIIQGSGVSGSSDMYNFPVLVKFDPNSYPELKHTGYTGGHVGKTTGGDIFFTNDEGSKCDHEIEKYDPATGELIAWVEVPELYWAANTTLYMYYGYGSAADQWNPTGVWDAEQSSVRDTFTGTNGTLLSAHNPDVGNTGSWTYVPGGANNLNIQTDTLRLTAVPATEAYKNSTPPPGPDYVVKSDVQFNGTLSTNHRVYLLGRVNAANTWAYVLEVRATGSPNVFLNRRSPGETTLCSYTATLTAGTWNRFYLRMKGSSLTAEGGGSSCTATDSTITAAGNAGIGLSAASLTTDVIADDFVVDTDRYAAVYHMNQDPSGAGFSVLDSTENNIDLTSDSTLATGDLVSGQIGYGIYFDGSEVAPIDHLRSSSTITSQSVTVEAWVQSSNWTTDWQAIVDIDNGSIWRALTVNSSGQVILDNSGSYSQITGAQTGTAFRHVVARYDGNTTYLRGFINGTMTSYTPNPTYSSINGRVVVGSWYSNGTSLYDDVWLGTLDEVRIHNVALSDDWIITEYNNQSSPSTFYQVLAEETPSNVALDLTGNAMTIEAWVNFNSTSSYQGVLTKNGWADGYRLYLNNGSPSKRTIFELEAESPESASVTSAGTLSATTWYHVVGTWDGATMRLYFNGSVDGNTDSKTNPLQSAGKEFWIGHGDHAIEKGWSYQFNGVLDEVRISNVARSACWIGTSYNNQNSTEPGTHLTLGAEGPAAPTAVKLTSFTATQYSEGVLLRWKTGYEVDNLGFHIYREENGKLVRLTPEPVAGSALLAGSRTALTAGHHYHWWDASLSPQSSSLGTVKYWLKDIDLNGTHTMHGPVTPVLSREPIPDRQRPELLSERGMKLQERYHHYWRVQDLKEKLSKKQSAIRHRPLAVNASNLKARRAGPRGNSIPDPQTQQFLAGRPAVKLFVREEGWYRVSQSELVAAGLSSKVNPHSLQLYVDGKEQPIRVIGGKDGRFGSRDAIEFYGVGLDTSSTDTRVYWLVEGLRPGKRVELSHSQGGRIVSSSFPYTVERKDRVIYLSAIKNGDEENFFGSVVYGLGVDQLLEVKHLDTASSEDALLEVVLQGATNIPHRVKVLLNDKEVGEVVFEGQSKGLLQIEVPQALLDEGDNLVSFIPLGGEMDVSLVDTIKLTYWHTYTADDNGLRLTAQGGGHLTVNGFSHPKIRVIDISDSNDVIEVLGKVESQKGSYAVSFRVPGTEQRTLLALTEEKVKSPGGITPNQPSLWHQSKDGCDLVIVTHRDFFDTLEPLKKLREFQGLKVALIDVEDLYDEFNFGAKSPKAIKEFLTTAKAKWKRSPRFVLLVGDASLDPRNYLGFGDLDFVPTKLIDTVYLETASDDWFVDLNNDGLPEMAIGRLPVQTAEEAAIVVSKNVGYEKSGKKNEALLVADRVDNSDDFNFEGASEELRALLPAYLTVRKIFRGQFSSDTQAKAELLNGINSGPLMVNFIGHGSIESWRGSLLTLEDGDSLINGLRLPFFVNMTCLNGFFQNPYGETLAESLMKASGGGAIAVWTSSGLTEPDKQSVMNKELIKLLFGREPITLGEATAKAKASVSDQDVRKTWVLFGDPTTRLK